MSAFCKKHDLRINSRFKNDFHSVFKTTLKYILLVANSLIIADAIFLLINEKDNFQGDFIEGRHPATHLIFQMLTLDIESFIMILIGCLGIIGTKKNKRLFLAIYCIIMVMVGVISYPDLDASFSELAISLISFVYLLMIKQRESKKYTEIIATIA